MYYHHTTFKDKLRARFAAFLGILPGIFFLIVTQTDFGKGISIKCGYWFILLILMSIIWFTYAIFVKKIITDFRLAYEHSVESHQKRHFQMAYMSTIFEAVFACIIFLTSTVGFLLVDMRCFLNKIVEATPLK